MVIHFEYFDVEGFGQCEDSTHSDYVLFSNYKTVDRTNKRFCGANTPLKGPVQSESNYFRMVFFTNDIFDATGFYAHYQFLDQSRFRPLVIRVSFAWFRNLEVESCQIDKQQDTSHSLCKSNNCYTVLYAHPSAINREQNRLVKPVSCQKEVSFCWGVFSSSNGD